MKEEEEEEVCKTMISDLAFNTVPDQKILYNSMITALKKQNTDGSKAS